MGKAPRVGAFDYQMPEMPTLELYRFFEYCDGPGVEIKENPILRPDSDQLHVF